MLISGSITWRNVLSRHELPDRQVGRSVGQSGPNRPGSSAGRLQRLRQWRQVNASPTLLVAKSRSAGSGGFPCVCVRVCVHVVITGQRRVHGRVVLSQRHFVYDAAWCVVVMIAVALSRCATCAARWYMLLLLPAVFVPVAPLSWHEAVATIALLRLLAARLASSLLVPKTEKALPS